MKGMKTKCCEDGLIHTEMMRNEFHELQNPPAEYLSMYMDTDKRKRNELFNNTKALNNIFAFASIHGEKAPPQLLGGRMDTCKYNG